MAIVSITVDVYCNRSEGEPNYRVYVDNEMLTERSWTWPGYEVFVKEVIDVDVGPGAHRIEVRECNCDPVFHTENITINGNPIGNTSGVFFV
jgi:hypothetical protein